MSNQLTKCLRNCAGINPRCVNMKRDVLLSIAGSNLFIQSRDTSLKWLWIWILFLINPVKSSQYLVKIVILRFRASCVLETLFTIPCLPACEHKSTLVGEKIKSKHFSLHHCIGVIGQRLPNGGQCKFCHVVGSTRRSVHPTTTPHTNLSLSAIIITCVL